MNKSILSTLSKQLTHLTLNRVAVLTDSLRSIEYSRRDKMYRYSQKISSNIDCLIIGKEHYSEQNRSFPIQSRQELHKILKLESLNSDNIMQYSIGDYSDGQRNVTCWQIKPQSLAELDLTPLVLIPESALLLSAKSGQLLSVTRQNGSFWFIDRQGQYLCAEKKGLISSSAMFLASAGLNDQIETVDIDESQYLGLLMKALAPELLKNIRGFKTHLRQLATVDWAAHLKYSGISAAILLAGYFSLTSMYLNLRLESAKAASVGFNAKTGDILQLREQLLQINEKTTKVDQTLKVVQSPNVIWRMIVPLTQRGVSIVNIGMSPEGIFSIKAEADKATTVLEFINNDPTVLEPRFRGQSTALNNKEQFTVAFKIRQGA